MADAGPRGAACACGQVVLDLAGRKVGQTLACPYCSRKYRYAGEDRVEPLAEGDATAGAEKEQGTAAGAADEIAKSPAPDKAGAEAKPEAELIASAPGKPFQPVARPSAARRSKASRIRAPGGLWLVIAFIVVFNSAALIAKSFLFPDTPDGFRMTPWGSKILRQTVWPEMLAVLVGHAVGFVFWLALVYGILKRRQAAPELAEPQEKPDAP